MNYKNKPDYLTRACAEYNSLHQQYQFLQTINPVPVFDIEDVGCAMDKNFERLQRAIRAYNSTPKVCSRCKQALVADGDDMVCTRCGLVYYPEFVFDPIPF